MRVKPLPKGARALRFNRDSFEPDAWYLCLWWVYITNEPTRGNSVR